MNNTQPSVAPRLTSDEVRQFNERGYLIHNRPVLPAPRFDALKGTFESLLEEWTATGVSRSPEHMDVPHFWSPQLFDFLFDDAVLDLVEPIIGPDIVLFSSHFICKPPAVGKRVPWHEDSAYWKGRLDPMTVVTVWLAIDPSTTANGCMRVIPGTHDNGFSDYESVADPDKQVFDTEIRKESVDESKAVDIVLAPNECSLHDGRIIHGSSANTGAMRRCGYTMRYMPATVRHNGGDDAFQIYLARGKDRAGNTYGDPATANRAWIDAHPDGQPAGH